MSDEEPQRTMTQTAPWPEALEHIINTIQYLDNWTFRLYPWHDRGQGSQGTTLVITVIGTDSYHPEVMKPTAHYFIVPAASYDYNNWRRWVLDQINLVEIHERGEHFVIGGEHPYAPNHGPGHNPYVIRELATDEERRTSFRGVIKPAYEHAGDFQTVRTPQLPHDAEGWGRIDYTYWPDRQEWEVHAHRDPDGDGPAVPLPVAEAPTRPALVDRYGD